MQERPSTTRLRKLISNIGIRINPQEVTHVVEGLILPITNDEIFMVTDSEQVSELSGEVFPTSFSKIGISQRTQISPEWIAAKHTFDRAAIRFGAIASMICDDFYRQLGIDIDLFNSDSYSEEGILQSLRLGETYMGAFVLFFDTGISASLVVEGVLEVAKGPAIARITPEAISSFAVDASQRGYKLSMAKQADLFLSHQRREDRLRHLFNEAPHGFMLIEESAKQVRGERNRITETTTNKTLSFLTPECAKAGANFAERLYKAVYPHAVAAHQRLI